MKIFGKTIGGEKAVPFPQFRDRVRAALRREAPDARMEPITDGFILTLENQHPITCNLRNQYNLYSKSPDQCDTLIKNWLATLLAAPPEHTWHEARPLLRPTLKTMGYMTQARASLLRNNPPDELPAEAFVGELMIILMLDLNGTAAAVTQRNLDEWGVTFAEAMREALSNMGLMKFPEVGNALVSGGASKGASPQEEVGLIFEGDHLTATWLVVERFRDFIGQRLQGDYIVTVPTRSRLVAVRAGEPGLIASVQQSNRTARNQAYALTSQCYAVSTSTTGGLVTVYQAGGLAGVAPAAGVAPLAAGSGAASAQPAAPAMPYERPKATDLSSWGGITEPTDNG